MGNELTYPLDNTWLTASNTDPIYLLLNTLATPNPRQLLFANDWVEQAFPIYNGTALAHLIGQSPWLVKLKPSAYAPLGNCLTVQGLSDNTWGWRIAARWIGNTSYVIGKTANWWS
ncbi:DUF4123 domain-containing protein [Providencia hangzhouensis]|uniref:DUF4123 domain-containing protein n=1 Tax=Providencia hangzhouensis TaxID=3031799 RepID=UPI00397E43B3